MKNVTMQEFDNILTYLLNNENANYYQLQKDLDFEEKKLFVACIALKEKGYINFGCSKTEVFNIAIGGKGIAFILTTSHVKEKEKEDIEKDVSKSVIRTNRLTSINIYATLGVALIVLLIQVMTYQRDERKERLELRQEYTNKEREEKMSRHDSLYV